MTTSKLETNLKPGELIWYTDAHLGLLIKPENGEDIWRVGLFIKHLTGQLGNCIILDVDGREKQWPTYLIQRMATSKKSNAS